MVAPLRDPEREPSILVVEDEETIRELLFAVLEPEGFSVRGAPDGAAALAMLGESSADAILLDLGLPDMDGMQLFETVRARQEFRQVPVICLTGQSDVRSKLRAFEAGAVDYLVKPFDTRELVARLRMQLSRRAMLDQRREATRRIKDKARAWVKVAAQRFDALVSNSSDLVCELDGSLRFVYFSPNHQDILFYDASHLEGAAWPDFIHPSDRERAIEVMRDALQSQTSGRVLLRFRDAEGAWRWLDSAGSIFSSEDGEPRLLLVSRDITEEKQSAARLQHLALHDPLTDLGNRQLFSTELDSFLAGPEPERCGGVIYLDVDNFKLVNDSKGHHAGDELLRTVASVLQDTLGAAHLICRLGGDEFCVLLRGVTPEEAEALVEQIVENCRHQSGASPANVAMARAASVEAVSDAARIGVTVSVGLAMIEPDVNAEELLARADSALQAAKRGGKNRWRLYQAESEELRQIRRSADWYHRIHDGIFHDRFEVWYQPVARLGTGAIEWHEALLRFRGEEGRIHSPGEFLPVAERFNIMAQLDRYVIRRVLGDLSVREGWSASINLSGSSITDPAMGDFILNALDKFGVNPARVIFEITETVFITNLPRAQSIVSRLQQNGCSFALDDFGSGFSSLNYLKKLPVKIVKIDGSFIQELRGDPVNLALLRSMNEIAHLLGKSTVAEHVDSAELVPLLTAIGVDHAQGYLIGRPAQL